MRFFLKGAAALTAALALVGVAGAAYAGSPTDSTTTSLASSVNPSLVNQNTTLTATITPTTPGVCAGGSSPVAFQNGGSTMTCTGGTQTISSTDGNHTFTATCVVSFPTPGPKSLTAIYSGNGNCLGSNSNGTPLTQTVNSPTPVPTLMGWAAYLLTALLLGGGLWFMARRNKVSPFTAA